MAGEARELERGSRKQDPDTERLGSTLRAHVEAEEAGSQLLQVSELHAGGDAAGIVVIDDPGAGTKAEQEMCSVGALGPVAEPCVTAGEHEPDCHEHRHCSQELAALGSDSDGIHTADQHLQREEAVEGSDVQVAPKPNQDHSHVGFERQEAKEEEEEEEGQEEVRKTTTPPAGSCRTFMSKSELALDAAVPQSAQDSPLQNGANSPTNNERTPFCRSPKNGEAASIEFDHVCLAVVAGVLALLSVLSIPLWGVASSALATLFSGEAAGVAYASSAPTYANSAPSGATFASSHAHGAAFPSHPASGPALGSHSNGAAFPSSEAAHGGFLSSGAHGAALARGPAHRGAVASPWSAGQVCSKAASLPGSLPPRRWELDAAAQRQCESHDRAKYPWQYPFGRNWCWIGMKAMCHQNLKQHWSWAETQERASHATVPRQFSSFSPLASAELCDRPQLGGARVWTADSKAAARAWFESHVAVYVLGLESDSERFQMVSARLAELGIRATRIDGVDMRAPQALQTAKAQGWVPSGFNFTLAQSTAYTQQHQMGSILGTLGCASAHFKAQAMALSGDRPLAVVFEDDVWLVDDFVERLWSLVTQELPCDWEVVSLMSRCPFGTCISQHLSRVQPDVNEPTWRCHQGVNWGMQGILYRTSALAALTPKWQRAVFDESQPHCMDVDVALASISDQVAYYAVPAVQSPGFLVERDMGSTRDSINKGAASSATRPVHSTPVTA